MGFWSVAEGRECQLLAPRSDRGTIGGSAISPDGRFAAVSSTEGWITIFDLETERELASTRLAGAHGTQLVFDAAGRLYTASEIGTQRWPVRNTPAEPGLIQFGPPEPVALKPRNNSIERQR